MVIQALKLAHHFRNQRKTKSIFVVLRITYEKVLQINDQLLCPEAQAQVGEEYSELKNSFAQFQRKLRQVIAEAQVVRLCINQRFMTCLKSEH